MMDDFDGDNDYCEDAPKYITAATQTIPNLRTKKIRPVAHPGLKLQTPIAFKSDSDPNAIPIAKDGMGKLTWFFLLKTGYFFLHLLKRFVRNAARWEFGMHFTQDIAIIVV